MSHDYFVFKLSHAPGYALIDDDPPDTLRPMDLREGLSVKTSFPGNATCYLSMRHKGKKLSDFFSNIMGHLIVNDKARAVLETEKLAWEWYPLKIVDQKEKPFTSKYTWAHLLGQTACVDLKKSEYTPDPMDPACVHTFERLVLDPKRIPKDASLFRIKEQPGTKIIRSDLVERLTAATVTGFKLLELDSPILL
jgi:hypothetical protein